jgi:hypothetical protein
LMALSLQIPEFKVNQAELRLDLPNGASIRLLGADDPHALRGIYLDGVILDEYAQMKPSVWNDVIRPALSDREGWAVFVGTPFGQNHFYDLYLHALLYPHEWSVALFRASETGVIPENELTSASAQMSPEAFAREYECSWVASVPGAYYAEELNKLEASGRIRVVRYNPQFPVSTAWDLGHNDLNAIWYFQTVGGEVRFLAYEEASSTALPQWITRVRSRPWNYDHSKCQPQLTQHPFELHYGPHDLENHEYSTGKTRYGVALEHGFRFTVLRRGRYCSGAAAVRPVSLRRGGVCGGPERAPQLPAPMGRGTACVPKASAPQLGKQWSGCFPVCGSRPTSATASYSGS